MKTRILSLLVVASLIISTSLFAQSRKEGKQRFKSQERDATMQKNLAHQRSERQSFFTEEQQETMKQLRFETAKKVKPLKNELRELEAHQQTITTADKTDLNAINKNIEKMSEAKTEIAKIMAAQHQQVRSLLTEEQRIKFDNMKEKNGRKKSSGLERNNVKHKNQMHYRKGA